MILSGTHTSGILAADFGLPAHTALRYEQPDRRLRHMFPDYFVFDSDGTQFRGAGSWLLPGWATIWIVLTKGPIGVTIANRNYGPLGSASIYGVTSRAMPVTTSGGITVAVTVSPLGWARFFAPSAELLRDRLMPLDDVLVSRGWAAELIALIHSSDRGPEVKGLLDRFFLDRLPSPHPDEPLIARLMKLLADPSMQDLVHAAAELGISEQVTLRLIKRHFGFPPKALAMRSRFLRAIVKMITSGHEPGAVPLPSGYYDASHFIRDGIRFLGMTPRRFLATDLTYLQAVLRARLLVLRASALPPHVRAAKTPDVIRLDIEASTV